MLCNQRGMALISVVMMLTALLSLAHILVEKVWQSTRQRADAAHREQLDWAARAGVEYARRQLLTSYAGSAGWQTVLFTNLPQAYPASATWVTTVNGIPVEIFLRDNADGDGDLHADNDLKIFVLARSRGRDGAEAMVESLCGFESTAGRGVLPGLTSSGVSLADQPVSRYGVTD